MSVLLRWSLSLALVVVGCGGALSDAQRLWCEGHDMTQSYTFGDNDDRVLQAAEDLGIAVPEVLTSANNTFHLWNAGGGGNPPEGWPDALDAWRKTADYARACIAAFDSR